MPYEVRRRGAKYVTVTKGTGRVHGTFDTRAQAEAQLRALYANAPPEAEAASKAKMRARIRKRYG